MVRVNYGEGIRFDHLVIFEQRNQVFAAARETGTGRIRLFLVNENTGDVFSRNGRSNAWEEIYGENRSSVVNKIYAARHNRTIPVYSFSGALSA